MIIQTIGSAIIIPQYPICGAKKKAIKTFPINSKELENTGVLESPNPCILFLNRQITAGTKYKEVLTLKYKEAVSITSWISEAVIIRIIAGAIV